MICLVTGAAGFIGSHLSWRLLKEGYQVKGVDSFTDFYPRWIKEKNLRPLLKHERFDFAPEDLNQLDLRKFLKKIDSIFHLAAQAGVRTSWGKNFSVYTQNNIQATQRLLEAAKENSIEKFVYASSSSVYGSCPHLPMSETSPVYPFSPYGVTKLAAEHLCSLYFKNYGVPCVALRLFTVYGPRQRPDMAFHKFLKAIAEDKPISIFGDGSQTRDFTYIDDVIEAHFSALRKAKNGETYNIGGGNRKKLQEIIPMLEDICKKEIHIKWEEKQKGDVLHTFADVSKARRDLNFSPSINLLDGLREEWNWMHHLYSL
ncbi:MAG: NAD-dependent epimerase/dehydratase family protein [Candidatus Aminicenantes bacterium]